MKLAGQICIAVFLAALCALPVFADDIVYQNVYLDPATLHIGNPPAGGDPNPLLTNSFDVLQNSGGAGTLNNPWLIILGVPNTTTANPFGTGITTAGFTQVLPNSSTATIPSWAYVGYKTTMGSGQEAYTQLGLSGPGVDMSNNFVNWSGAESSLANINATSFGLYEFQIWDTLSGGDSITLDFDTLPDGTIAIAWGQTSSTSSTNSCTGIGRNRTCTTIVTTTYTTYDSPFTEAGFKVPPPRRPPQVPEPGSMMLVSAGILALAGLKRIRR